MGLIVSAPLAFLPVTACDEGGYYSTGAAIAAWARVFKLPVHIATARADPARAYPSPLPRQCPRVVLEIYCLRLIPQ